MELTKQQEYDILSRIFEAGGLRYSDYIGGSFIDGHFYINAGEYCYRWDGDSFELRAQFEIPLLPFNKKQGLLNITK